MDEKITTMGDYRKLYTDETGQGTCVARDRFARYMYERWGDKHTDDRYGREWAQRFYKGEEWQASDNEGKRVLVEILTSPCSGTARQISEDKLKEFLEEVTDDE